MSDQVTEELKPCPFCGKPAKKYGINIIGCSNVVSCGAQVDSGDSGERTWEFTVDAWNRRVAHE